MGFVKLVTTVTFTLLLGASAAMGQSVISAKAGVLHYTEGDVSIATGAAVLPAEARVGGRYTELKEGQELLTAEGRAELLLNPGVFLRLAENGRVKMISSRLSDTRLELLSGVALIEVAEVSRENAVTILVKDAAVSFSKMGLVRLDAANGIRVYKGEVQVIAGSTPQILKEGRQLPLSAGAVVAKFDAKQGDPLYRWSNQRAEYIAMANIASAQMVQTSGGSYPAVSGWYYNQFYGMMTYLPMGNGMYRSPFGYFFYSPSRVQRYYQSYLQPSPVQGNTGYGGGGASARTWSPDNGYYVTQSRSAVSGAMSAPAGGGNMGGPAAAAPAPAEGGRGADTGTGRGGASSSGH